MVFRGLSNQICLIYLDDILVFSPVWSEHVSDVEKVLTRLREAGLTMKPEKCFFARKEVRYLAYVISKSGISVR